MRCRRLGGGQVEPSADISSKMVAVKRAIDAGIAMSFPSEEAVPKRESKGSARAKSKVPKSKSIDSLFTLGMRGRA